MATAAKKKPSAAQLRARAAFAARVKAGEFRGARRKAASGSKKAASKKRRVSKPPSKAQLAARAKFVAMVRARAAAKNPKRKSKAARRRDQRLVHAPKSTKASRAKAKASVLSADSWIRKNASGVVRFKSEKEYSDWLRTSGHGARKKATAAPVRSTSAARGKKRKKFKRTGIFGGSGFLGLGRSRKKISARNPRKKSGIGYFGKKTQLVSHTGSRGTGKVFVTARTWGGLRRKKARATKRLKGLFNPHGQHLPGLPPKYQRMYEDVLASSGSKRIAAATTEKAFKRQNPSMFSRLFGRGRKVARVGYRRTQVGKRKVAAVGYRRTQRGQYRPTAHTEAIGRKRTRSSLRNPSPASVFEEFRGKDATTRTQVKAASGTPKVLAKLGTLIELHVEGKKLHFGPGASLAADGRKKLYVVGTKFAKPNPPGEVDYGEIKSVVYRANKPVVEAGTFDYKHHFGEDGGKRPHLVIDEEGFPIIEGGSYKITSDGIVD